MTIRSLLPPRGVFVPTDMIFHSQLPSAVLVTWIQLRCLASDGLVTPPFSISELAALIGIHPARLHRHLSQLEDISALSWHTEKNGKLIITFPQESFHAPNPPVETPAVSIHTILHTLNTSSATYASYFPARILGYLSYDEDEYELLSPSEPAGGKDRQVKIERQYTHQVQSLCSSNY